MHQILKNCELLTQCTLNSIEMCYTPKHILIKHKKYNFVFKINLSAIQLYILIKHLVQKKSFSSKTNIQNYVIIIQYNSHFQTWRTNYYSENHGITQPKCSETEYYWNPYIPKNGINQPFLIKRTTCFSDIQN